jgi:hypothetical protein
VEEDSLNLTIGEEDEQLLREETDEKKPGGNETANVVASDKVDAEKTDGDKVGDGTAKEGDKKPDDVENG